MRDVFKVADSPIHGRGVFAACDLPADSLVLRICGRVMSYSEGELPPTGENPDWFGIAPRTWVAPDFPGNLVNHSCEPTCSFRRHGWLVAKRDLRAGEELTIDYSTTEADDDWRMECRCRAAGCRGTLYAVHIAFPDYACPPDAPEGILGHWREAVATRRIA